MTTRRTVLKSIAAALFAPVIQLRQAIPDERLLAAFCASADESYRYHLNAPFGVGSLTYATDARGIVRAEIANRLEVGERRLPRVDELFWKTYWNNENQWRPLTLDDIEPTEVCPVFAVPCPECGGRRVSLGKDFPDFTSPVVDAEMHKRGYGVDDNSILDKSCRTCRGMNYFGKSICRVSEIKHATHMLRRIVALPNVMVCHSQSVPQAMLFRADGFEGISLGLTE